MAALMSSIFSKRPGAVFRSKVVDLASWNMELVEKATRICTFMLLAPMPKTWRRLRSSAKTY
jgi:N-acetylmuramic acid 6-phosphate (MurNAc-6-P) etherase